MAGVGEQEFERSTRTEGEDTTEAEIVTLSCKIGEFLRCNPSPWFGHEAYTLDLYKLLSNSPRHRNRTSQGEGRIPGFRGWVEKLLEFEPYKENVIFLDLARFGPRDPGLVASLIVHYSTIPLPFGPRYCSLVSEAEPSTQVIREAKVVLELTRRDPSWFGVKFSKNIPETNLDMGVLQDLLDKKPELRLHPEVMRLTIPDFVFWDIDLYYGEEEEEEDEEDEEDEDEEDEDEDEEDEREEIRLVGTPPLGHPNALLVADDGEYRVYQGGKVLVRGSCQSECCAVVPLSNLESILRRLQPGVDSLGYRVDRNDVDELCSDLWFHKLPEDHIAKVTQRGCNKATWESAMEYILFLQAPPRLRLLRVLASAGKFTELDYWKPWVEEMLLLVGGDIVQLANELCDLGHRGWGLALLFSNLAPHVDNPDLREEVRFLVSKYNLVHELRSHIPMARRLFEKRLEDRVNYPLPSDLPTWMVDCLESIVFEDTTRSEQVLFLDIRNGTNYAEHLQKPWIDICLDPSLDVGLQFTTFNRKSFVPTSLETASDEFLVALLDIAKSRANPIDWVGILEAMEEPIPATHGDIDRTTIIEFLRSYKLQGAPTQDQIQAFKDLGGVYPFDATDHNPPSRKCPRCQAPNQRDGECLLITCECGYQWCYACLGEGHTRTCCFDEDKTFWIQEISAEYREQALNPTLRLNNVFSVVKEWDGDTECAVESKKDREEGASPTLMDLLEEYLDPQLSLRRNVIFLVRSADKLSVEEIEMLHTNPFLSDLLPEESDLL